MRTRTIEPGDAEDLMWGAQVEPWTKVAEQHVSEHRWHDRHWLVLRHEDGTHWGLTYDKGKTEYQETEWPWRDKTQPLELTRLYPHEITRIEYRSEPPSPATTGAAEGAHSAPCTCDVDETTCMALLGAESTR